MKIRTLIVDDEPLGRTLIKRMLAQESDFVMVGECVDGAEALSTIQRESPDLVFLDVQMPKANGFEVLANLNKEQTPAIVFVTAYDAFALKAFEAHALDYLLKPVSEERFFETLGRVKTYIAGCAVDDLRHRLAGLTRELAQSPKFVSRLAVESGGSLVFLKVAEIDWVQAAGNYLELHAGKKSYLLRGRISGLEKRLRPEEFFRVHRSTIVNLDRVKEFKPLFKGEGLVVLKDGAQLPASRSCSQRLQAFLEVKL
jgi:two-component system LytT family response regulator